MSSETNSPDPATDPTGIQAVFVRAAGGYQTWVSVSTSREFEVAEHHSALPTSLLEPGDLGQIAYSGATAVLRNVALVLHHQPSETAGDATSWVRAAMADLGCGAPLEALETAAVARMAVSHVADRRAGAQSIGEACARLGRHRRPTRTPDTRRAR